MTNYLYFIIYIIIINVLLLLSSFGTASFVLCSIHLVPIILFNCTISIVSGLTFLYFPIVKISHLYNGILRIYVFRIIILGCLSVNRVFLFLAVKINMNIAVWKLRTGTALCRWVRSNRSRSIRQIDVPINHGRTPTDFHSPIQSCFFSQRPHPPLPPNRQWTHTYTVARRILYRRWLSAVTGCG